MGGIYLRYILPQLARWTSATLWSFITLATPHLGVSGCVTRYPSWALSLTQSGNDLLCGGQGIVGIEKLTEEEYLAPLRQFCHRTAYAPIYNDGMVSFPSASLYLHYPNSYPSGLSPISSSLEISLRGQPETIQYGQEEDLFPVEEMIGPSYPSPSKETPNLLPGLLLILPSRGVREVFWWGICTNSRVTTANAMQAHIDAVDDCSYSLRSSSDRRPGFSVWKYKDDGGSSRPLPVHSVTKPITIPMISGGRSNHLFRQTNPGNFGRCRNISLFINIPEGQKIETVILNFIWCGRHLTIGL